MDANAFDCLVLAEGLWLPLGPVRGGGDVGRVLGDGPAVVRGGHRALHLPREQPKAGVGVLRTWRAAEVPGHPRAALHRLHDLHADGMLRFHDLCVKGQRHTPCSAAVVYLHFSDLTKMKR